MQDTNTNQRLARNTILLYCRMFVMMGVAFYTTRVLLQVLGVDDYGIYNTIAGVVILFAFLNNAMITTTQRFLNYYLGQENEKLATSSFSMSLIVHFFIAVIMAVLAEIIGLWFLYNKMSLPSERFDAAFWSLHLSVAITFVNIIRSPYNACIIAYEKMDFYAYISIVEALLNLLIVYVLVLVNVDHLIFYCILLFIVTLSITYAYKLYCNHHYTISIFKMKFDKEMFSSLFHFSLYSLLGNAANVGAQQGVNLMVNSFTNVAVNAAIGVSNQLSRGIYSFITNFQIAFNPILVKMYARNELSDLKRMICQVSRFSFYLMVVISLPIIVYANDFLQLWLKEVPVYSADFCRLTILTLLIDTIAEPLWKTVQASGNIKRYQIITSFIILLNLPVAYFILRAGYSPVYIFIAKFLINILAYLYRAFFVKQLISFQVKIYLKDVIIPITIISLALILIGFLSYSMITNYIISSLVMFICSTIFIWVMGLNAHERRFIFQEIHKKLPRK